jgi:hypothetical protein
MSLVVVAAIVAVAGNALGQVCPPSPSPAPSAATPDTAGAAELPPHWRPLSGFGMSVAGGGGVTDFTQSSVRSLTDVGGSWDVRLAFGTRRLLGFEVSYVGGANMIHGLGFDSSHTKLIRNGIEGALRLNAPLYVRGTLLEPYVAAGLGWNGYRITNVTTATANVSSTNENTLSVPLAVGFAVGYKGFIADVRYTIRPTYKQTTLRDDGSGALTNWDAGAMLGYEF